MGVLKLWHLSQTMDDILVHVIEGLGSLLGPVLAAQRLRIVRLLGMDSRRHQEICWVGPRVIKGPVDLGS